MTVYILDRLETASFRSIVWLLPVLSIFHELEEWNIMEWYNRFYVDMPESTNLSARVWIFTIILVGFLLTGMTLIPKNPKITAYLMLPIIALSVTNGLQHDYWFFYFKAYAPGMIFGGIVCVSCGIYLIRRALVEKLIPFWYPLLFLPYTVMVLKSTVEAGNTLSPSIKLIHRIGIQLASYLL